MVLIGLLMALTGSCGFLMSIIFFDVWQRASALLVGSCVLFIGGLGLVDFLVG
jgi:hypothetical protein